MQRLGCLCQIGPEVAWTGEPHEFGAAGSLGQTWCLVSVKADGRWEK